MSNRELFTSQSNVFSGLQKTYEKADYVVLGIPFDVTSTYRTGARFAPNAIRQASLNIETCSLRSGIDVEDLNIHDLGDLHTFAATEKTLETLTLVTRDIAKDDKLPVTIGGEHTITLGVIRGFEARLPETCIISFDAHLDLRNEYSGLTLSHTTFMRRINEQTKPAKIVEIGTRAVCQEELAYSQKAGIRFFPAGKILDEGSDEILRQLKLELRKAKYIYVSIDVDVLDPAFAPAVQNPEPEGLDVHTLLNLLTRIVDKRVIGFDFVEVTPPYDKGNSAVVGAKIIFEMLCALEKASKRQKHG